MKIYITGVAGFLGSHLAERMLKLGHEVVGIDNLEGGYLRNVPSGVEFYEGDCLDLDLLNRTMKGAEVVYHAACTAYDGLSVFSPHYVTQNTFQNSVSTISSAIQNGVRRFVYCSSMARYGKQDRIPFEETMSCNPENPYGIAKLSVEKALEGLATVHQMEYVILVPHNIIGPRQCYEDPYRNVASIMINRILQNKPPIIYGDGNQMRCFSFIEDVIHCFEISLTSPDVNKEIINVGPDEEFVTINQLCQIICRLLKVDFAPTYVAARPLEVHLATCSANKARHLLQYKTQTTLEQGLSHMIEYIKQMGPRPFKYNHKIEILNHLTPKTWSEKLF
jgi:UDP-glucose 4-epimerase